VSGYTRLAGHFTPEERSLLPTEERLCGTQGRSGHLEKRKSFSPPEIGPEFSSL